MKQDSFVANPRLFQALVKRSKECICLDFTTLFKRGDFPEGLYILREGQASLLLLSPTDRIISSFHAGPGSILGLPAVIGLVPYTLTAIARKGSIVGFVERGTFNDLLQEEPAFYPLALSLLASEARSARLTLPGVREISRPATQLRKTGLCSRLWH